MTDLTIDEARTQLHGRTQNVLNKEAECEQAGERAADAEAVYRHELAEAFKRYREAGDAVEASSVKARGETAVLKRESLAAAAALKLAHEKIEDARDARRSLWRLIEWSREHDRSAPASNGPAQQRLMDESAPSARWP